MGAPIYIMAVFGLESTDIAFLGLIFGMLSAILGPLTYFLINIAKNMNYLMNYAKSHDVRAEKEAEKLERVATKQAVIDNRVKSLEYRVFKSSGIFSQPDDQNGD